jgi:hypothetical protein
MKKAVIALVVVLLFSFNSYAQALGQSYQTAVGVKIYPGAISLKHFIKDDVALEGLAYFWRYGFRFTGLYEYHGEINGAPGLQWYIGPGAHIGFYNNDWEKNYPHRNDGVAIGVDGVIGLDYKIKGAPINLSLDWQPSFNIIGHTYFEGGWGGLGVRFALK